MAEKKTTRHQATVTYPHGSSTPSGEVLRDNVSMKGVQFPAKDSSDKERRRVMKEAKGYAKSMDESDKAALENQKEYGMKKGGKTASARADGCAVRGKTRA
jgi:hypothetical protein